MKKLISTFFLFFLSEKCLWKNLPKYTQARIGVVCISTDLSEYVRNTIENISIA